MNTQVSSLSLIFLVFFMLNAGRIHAEPVSQATFSPELYKANQDFGISLTRYQRYKDPVDVPIPSINNILRPMFVLGLGWASATIGPGFFDPDAPNFINAASVPGVGFIGYPILMTSVQTFLASLEQAQKLLDLRRMHRLYQRFRSVPGFDKVGNFSSDELQEKIRKDPALRKGVLEGRFPSWTKRCVETFGHLALPKRAKHLYFAAPTIFAGGYLLGEGADLIRKQIEKKD